MTDRIRGLARGVRETAGTGIVFAMAGAAAWLSLSVIAAPADAASQAARVSSGVPDDDAGFRIARDMTAACTDCAAESVPATAHPPKPEPLHLAAAHGIDPEVVWQHEAGDSYPVRGNNDQRVPGRRDQIALHRAAARNPDPSGVTELLKTGADLEVRDEEGRTALHCAAGSNASPAVVAALLDAGAELEARDDTGRTPLHWAAKWNHSEAVVAALLEAGAEVAARDENDGTPCTGRPATTSPRRSSRRSWMPAPTSRRGTCGAPHPCIARWEPTNTPRCLRWLPSF